MGCITLTLVVSCGEIKKLGKNEKKWAIQHPVAALKIKKIKKDCDVYYAEIKKHPDLTAIGLDTFANGGKLDAFRHLFYSAMFASKVKKRKVLSLGIAHEKDNHLSFLKNIKEDAELADSISCEMDLQNNQSGVELVQSFRKIASVKRTSEVCIDYIKNGKASFMKRDSKGNYLRCDGTAIDLKKYKGQWNVPKCLVQK